MLSDCVIWLNISINVIYKNQVYYIKSVTLFEKIINLRVNDMKENFEIFTDYKNFIIVPKNLGYNSSSQ